MTTRSVASIERCGGRTRVVVELNRATAAEREELVELGDPNRTTLSAEPPKI